MRVGLILSLAMLVASSAEAKPLRLLDVALHPPGADQSDNQDPDWGVVGWSVLEGATSVGTSLAFFLVSLPITAAIASGAGAEWWSGPLGLRNSVLGLSGPFLLASLLTSLIVWRIDRVIPGQATYGRILLFSLFARVAVLGALLTVMAVAPSPFIFLCGVLTTPIIGAAAEVVAARTAPVSTRMSMIGVPIVQAAF